MRVTTGAALGAGALIVIGCVGFVAGPAWGSSGIRIKSGPTLLDPTNPPCNAKRVTTYKITIENQNCVCNEDVNPIREANVLEVKPEEIPKGSFKFLGFTKTLPTLGVASSSLSPRIDFIDMEDESSADFYFQVETAPVACSLLGGGDFEKAVFGIVICDSGGGCDWGPSSDPPDPICESPKHSPAVVVEGDMTLCPKSETGTARIVGTVTDSRGPVSLARLGATKGCRGQPGFVNQNATSKALPLTQRGTYEIGGLPVGTYTMEVREAGRCAAATVSIAVNGETKTQNFTLPGVPTPCP